MNLVRHAHPPSPQSLLLYSSLALPLAFAGIPLYLHAPDFYASHYGVSFTLLGVILFVARIFDAVQDPFIGALCDRHRNASLALFSGAALLFGAGFFALFHPLRQWAGGWLLVSLFITTTSFSVLTILLTTLGAVWSTNPNQRTRIAVWRESFTLLGILLASALPAVLEKTMPAQAAFHRLSLGLIAALALASLGFRQWFNHNQLAAAWADAPANPFLFRQSLRNFFVVPPAMRGFFVSYGLSLLAATLPAVLVLFYIRDFLGAEQDSGLFLGLYFLSGMVGMPLWLTLAKKWGKTPVWLGAMAVSMVAFAGAVCLHPGDRLGYGCICVASGFSFGAELALPPALLADLVAREHASPRAASLFALLTFLSKAALAVASILVLPALAAFGFTPARANPAPALTALSFCYAGLPCIIKTAAFFTLKHWNKPNGARL